MEAVDDGQGVASAICDDLGDCSSAVLLSRSSLCFAGSGGCGQRLTFVCVWLKPRGCFWVMLRELTGEDKTLSFTAIVLYLRMKLLTVGLVLP